MYQFQDDLKKNPVIRTCVFFVMDYGRAKMFLFTLDSARQSLLQFRQAALLRVSRSIWKTVKAGLGIA